MDFPTEALAEQLTRMDSVREKRGVYIQYIKCAVFTHVCGFTVIYNRLIYGVLGFICQSGAIPVSGMCVVAKR